MDIGTDYIDVLVQKGENEGEKMESLLLSNFKVGKLISSQGLGSVLYGSWLCLLNHFFFPHET